MRRLTWAIAVSLALARESAHAASVLKSIATIQFTPDATHQTGSFPRINFVPATNRFVLTFGVRNRGASGECLGGGYVYKELTADLAETGNGGQLVWVSAACAANDSGSVLVGTTYYFVWVPDEPGFFGWRISRFDAVTWKKLGSIDVALDGPRESSNDPTIAPVSGGLLDVSAQFDEAGHPPALDVGSATHHRLFTADLQREDYRVLRDVPHVTGSSLIYVDGIHDFIAANAFLGDLIVMKYDSSWHFLGSKVLRSQAHWSQGVAFDGKRFFVSYLDTSQRRTGPDPFPIILNARLAAFDRDWNLVDDVAVTSFTRQDGKLAGRPWVIEHDGRLYVSYDVDTIDPATEKEDGKWQAFVSVFAIEERPVRRRAVRH